MHYAVRGKPATLVSLVKPERGQCVVGCACGGRNEKGLLAQRGVALGLG